MRSPRIPRLAAPVLCLLLLTAAAGAEERRPGPPKPEAQIKAIQALDFMVGNWNGQGWMDMGGRRAEFRGTENVQVKLDGTALLVEGRFFARPPGQETEIPVHTTLGVISYDAQAKKYRFASWLATGTSGERELTVTANGWQWEIKMPRGTTRYTMTLNEAGEWFEIGERSQDGTTWQKFFEMTLKK